MPSRDLPRPPPSPPVRPPLDPDDPAASEDVVPAPDDSTPFDLDASASLGDESSPSATIGDTASTATQHVKHTAKDRKSAFIIAPQCARFERPIRDGRTAILDSYRLSGGPDRKSTRLNS